MVAFFPGRVYCIGGGLGGLQVTVLMADVFFHTDDMDWYLSVCPSAQALPVPFTPGVPLDFHPPLNFALFLFCVPPGFFSSGNRVVLKRAGGRA